MSSSTYIVAPPPGSTASAGTSGADFLEFVRGDLAAIEARMNADLGSDVRTITALTDHILNAGGKRLRPAMVALAARAVCPEAREDRIATVGAAVEFVHMATLVHDDVVDNTATRRGKPTVNAVFGNGVAVLSGDYMLARAMRLLAIDGDLKIIRTVSEITIEMSEGEVMEISATGNSALPVDEYLLILHKKTAAFVEGCCRCGAVLGGASAENEEALSEYGYRLGMAFQLADDLLDYTGDPLVTGKPRGSDLRDGRATLPLLLALERVASTDCDRLLRAFGNACVPDEEVLACCSVIESCGGFESTRNAARDHVDAAASCVQKLPASTARDCFAALTDYVVQRDR